MSRLKIDFGIDLGTTNSAICKMDKGKVAIIKSDTQGDTLPSCVSINKKRSISVGQNAYHNMQIDKRNATKGRANSANSFIEFKRTMGTSETMHSDFYGKDFRSEELSAEVLKLSNRSFSTKTSALLL